ncbi:MAG: hypothetical protein AAFW82_04135 [Pseudomonadota bacterium]
MPGSLIRLRDERPQSACGFVLRKRCLPAAVNRMLGLYRLSDAVLELFPPALEDLFSSSRARRNFGFRLGTPGMTEGTF